ncbi:MAG: hypothetical protein KAS72_06740 [Phycisphaerales bacterium]|nr:hypothetical protein [Phycisphaerales bacterium]
MPGCSYRVIAVRNAGEWHVMRWDEVIMPGWGCGKPTEEYRQFVADWMQLRITLASVKGQRTQRIKAGEQVRGISVDDDGAVVWSAYPRTWWRKATEK